MAIKKTSFSSNKPSNASVSPREQLVRERDALRLVWEVCEELGLQSSCEGTDQKHMWERGLTSCTYP